MYEMFCGRPPFLAEGFGDLIIAHVSHPPPEPLNLAPSLSPEARRILLACLAKDPAARPQSMTELATALAGAGAGDLVQLRNPVRLLETMDARASSPSARSPAGLNAPRLAATTPMPPPQPTPISVGGTRVLQTGPTTFGGSASQITEPRPPPRAKGRSILVAALGATLIGATLLVLRNFNGGTAPPSPTSFPAAATEPAAAPERIRSGEPRPDRATNVSIDLAGLPAGAQVRLDGELVTLPIAVRRGLESHRIQVDADGFAPLLLSVDAATDRTLTVEMKKLPQAPSPSKAIRSDAKAHHKSEHRHGTSTFQGFTDL